MLVRLPGLPAILLLSCAFLAGESSASHRFLLAFAALALTTAASFPFQFGKFLRPFQQPSLETTNLFFEGLKLHNAIRLACLHRQRMVDLELNDETSQMSRHCFAATSIRAASSPFNSYLPQPYPPEHSAFACKRPMPPDRYEKEKYVSQQNQPFANDSNFLSRGVSSRSPES